MVVSYELYDDEAWDRGEAIFEAMRDTLFNEDLFYEIARFVTKHRGGGSPMKFFPPRMGGFNFHYRIQYSDDSSVIIRFPLPGYFQMAEEKLLAEVAAIRYIAHHTTIPVPFILHYGKADESPGKLGPFLIMEYIENSGDMIDVLRAPELAPEEKPVLNPGIDEAKLEYMYSQIAEIMLQLSKCNFSQIGCLGMRNGDEDGDGGDEPAITCRPLSFNMAQLGEVGGVPHFEFPSTSKTFSTSSEYYSALADMHLQQLSFQRSQAVKSAEDCRRKYIARAASSSHGISSPGTDSGPFKLWCDDFRPANILVDADHRIVGVVDWEFTYAAPVEFSYSPSWWLLLVMPEEWPKGLDDWAAEYEPRLKTFLRAMEVKELDFIGQGRLDQTQLLSTHMHRSWETGDFWLAYAARKSWAFDGVFWRTLDRRFFGDNAGGFMERLKLLPPKQVSAMEGFVERKMREKEECTLIDWYREDSESRLPPDILSVGSDPCPKSPTGGPGQGLRQEACVERVGIQQLGPSVEFP